MKTGYKHDTKQNTHVAAVVQTPGSVLCQTLDLGFSLEEPLQTFNYVPQRYQGDLELGPRH